MQIRFVVSFCLLFRYSTALRPHILFIVADDLGWNDVSWHNPQMITPNLEKLARNGVILNSSYVQPVCSPSRNCFMSGYYPFHTGLQHGVIHNWQANYLPGNLTLLPQKLKDLGYSTHMIGKWHLGFCNWKYTPTFRGFDSFLGFYSGAEDYYTHMQDKGYDLRFNKTVLYPPTGEYSANTFARRAVDIIATNDANKTPLFIYLPFQSVHSPLQVPKKYENMYPHIQDYNRRMYCGMVSALDEAVGNITSALERYGYMDNLLIVFTTDNGGPVISGSNNLPLRGAKTTLWEGGTKGSSFVYSKTLLKKTGYVNTNMIHAVDWYPTILAAAGAGDNIDSDIDGINQWLVVSHNLPTNRTEFIYNIDDVKGNAAMRVGDYKLIEGNPGKYNTWYPLPGMIGNDSKIDDLNDDTVDKKFKPQLFNIKDDPTEHFNIADSMPGLVLKLQNHLDEYRRSLVPAKNPPRDPKSNPKHYNGVWTPGWC